MKKVFLIFLSALCVITLCSCRFDSNLPDNSESQPVNDSFPPSDTVIAKADIKSYMSYFVNYFHEPYKAGDDLSDINVLYLGLNFAFSQSENFDFVKFCENEQRFEINESDLKTITDNLVGPGVDFSKYRESLKNTYDTYVDGKYIVCFARDYWNGDLCYIDNTAEVEINDSDNILTVTAKVMHVSDDLSEILSNQTLVYTFDKVTKDGFMFYRISNIKAAE